MATNSIYNSIKVRDRSACKKLVEVLESTDSERGKTVTINRPIKKMSKEDIRKVFK